MGDVEVRKVGEEEGTGGVSTEQKPLDGVGMVSQLLSTLPGHLTLATVLLYFLLVEFPARDQRHADQMAKKDDVWAQTVKLQREEFLAAERATTDVYNERIKELQNTCYGTIQENNRILKEIQVIIKDKSHG